MKLIKLLTVIFLIAMMISCASVVNPFSSEENEEAITAQESNISDYGNAGDISYNGNDTTKKDIMLQGFTWSSRTADTRSWYKYVNDCKSAIGSYFTVIWMPPPGRSESGSPQGYGPVEYKNLNNAYGTQAELKTMIATMHATPAVKVLADIVVNHRASSGTCATHTSVWNKFVDSVDATNYTWNAAYFINGQIGCTCNGNDGGTSGSDTEGSWSQNGTTYYCDDYGPFADIDHWYTTTQTKIKSWQTWLKSTTNAGFDGWRYDYVRGFAPSIINAYNTNSAPYISVSEWWKDPTGTTAALKDYVGNSGNKTMMFDFALKNKMNDAFQSTTFYGGALGVAGTAYGSRGLIGEWADAAVTFVDNHDTGSYYGGAHWPLPTPSGTTTMKAAYALILTHPGIPMVYWGDWQDCNGNTAGGLQDSDLKLVIETLIKIRRSNNVLRNSRFYVERAENGLYAAYIGTQGAEQVAVKIGKQGATNYEGWVPNSALGLTKTLTRYATGGHAFCVYYKNTAN